MIAGFEQLIYTPEMLEKEWENIVCRFEDLIEGGWANEAVLNLIKYIRKTQYSKLLFPGSSLGTLLISKPRNGKLNYQQTLSISDQGSKNKIKLNYSDWDIINKEEDAERAILWNEEINNEELIDKFEEFMNWNRNWC